MLCAPGYTRFLKASKIPPPTLRLGRPAACGKDDQWENRAQLAVLFDRDVKTIGKHINNALREELAGQREVVVAKFATTRQHGAMEGRTQTRLTEHYGLDMVLSVGYRVKSKRGVEFRRWTTDVLRRYIMEGSAVNERRLRQLSQVTSVMARIPERLETRQVLDIVQSYTVALDLLDDYDHQRINLPEGTRATYALSYDECIAVIKSMRFAAESDLFGVEKRTTRSEAASLAFIRRLTAKRYIRRFKKKRQTCSILLSRITVSWMATSGLPPRCFCISWIATTRCFLAIAMQSTTVPSLLLP